MIVSVCLILFASRSIQDILHQTVTEGTWVIDVPVLEYQDTHAASTISGSSANSNSGSDHLMFSSAPTAETLTYALVPALGFGIGALAACSQSLIITISVPSSWDVYDNGGLLTVMDPDAPDTYVLDDAVSSDGSATCGDGEKYPSEACDDGITHELSVLLLPLVTS